MFERDIRAVVFDNDDTKTATFKSVYQLMQEFAGCYKLERPCEDRLRGFWGKKIDEVWSGVFPNIPVEDIGKLRDEFIPESFIPPHFPGVREALLALKQRGYILGIISTGPGRYLTRAVDRLELGKGFFACVHGLEDTHPYHKPDPRTFDKAAAILAGRGIEEERVCYVGDSYIDLRAAKARGWGFLGVLTGITTREQFLDEGLVEKYILGSLPDILKVLPETMVNPRVFVG